MKDIIKSKISLKHSEISVDEALASVDGDPYQAKIVKRNEKNGKVSVYDVDGKIIVSDNVALLSTSDMKAVKLLSVAGAYWEGKSSNPMLQRIYGTSFYKQKDLEAELERQKEA
ncbi:threonine--tRNA ligase, partial [Enterococcus faecium]|nr:threonine--tRNA ligase [Enterococcus faecium]